MLDIAVVCWTLLNGNGIICSEQMSYREAVYLYSSLRKSVFDGTYELQAGDPQAGEPYVVRFGDPDWPMTPAD